MTYDDHDLQTVSERFGLDVQERHLFDNIQEVPLDPRIRFFIDRDRCIAQGSNTAKARSEFLIARILSNINSAVRWNPPIRLYSGFEMLAAPDIGLEGECDFVFSRSRSVSFFRPFFVVVTLGDENLATGFGPCIARLLGARLLNQRQRIEEPILFGLVTSGNLWRFLRLQDQQVAIDQDEYGLHGVDQIHSILAAILDERPTQAATKLT